MKKSFLFFISSLIIILGTSCSSIPKKANADEIVKLKDEYNKICQTLGINPYLWETHAK